MIIHDDLVLKKKETVLERFGEELLLFDSSTGKLFEVTDVDQTIWTMLNGQHTVKEIKNHLKEEFAKVQTIDSDVIEFLIKLQGLDLIKPVD